MDPKDTIASSILYKSSFEETGVADWQHIAEEHPAFGLSQLFFAVKLKEKDSLLFAQQLQKTALRFNNILWLNFLLTDIESDSENSENETSSLLQETKTEEEKFTDEEKLIENKLAAMLQSQAADFAKPVNAKDQLAIDTEPLYKTDYFASQGILIPKSQDAFGNKVKKFTDWLKDIKKSPSGVPQLNTTEEEEKLAAVQADASLKNEEVVTEPMAEVLVRQGKKPQAIELYKKLSLIYPEKSAYFAAKIDSLQ